MKQPVCAPGTVIGEKYRIDKAVARGGCSIVYQGTHLGMKRPVALKLMYTEVEGISEAWTHRFEREAQLVSQLSHPHTITLFDYGFDRGFWYIAMEWVEGASLRNVIREGGEMEPERCVRLTLMILESLMEAHRKHILHRDMKPSNIMITTNVEGEEVVKVLDFGLAKIDVQHLEGEALKLTMDGEFVGTPRYAAPEQLRFRELTAATDIYGVGMVMWEMLMGKPAVPQVDYASCVQHHLGPDPWKMPLGFVLPELASIVECALEKEVEKRFGSGAKMKEALERWLLQEGATGGDVGSSSPGWRLSLESEVEDPLGDIFDEALDASLLPPVELVGGSAEMERRKTTFEDELIAEHEEASEREEGGAQSTVENPVENLTRPVPGPSVRVGGGHGGIIAAGGHQGGGKRRSRWAWGVGVVAMVGMAFGGFLWLEDRTATLAARRGQVKQENEAILEELRAKQDQVMSAQGSVPAPWELAGGGRGALRPFLVSVKTQGWERQGEVILTAGEGIVRTQVSLRKGGVSVEVTVYQCETQEQVEELGERQASDVVVRRSKTMLVGLRAMKGEVPEELVSHVEHTFGVRAP